MIHAILGIPQLTLTKQKLISPTNMSGLTADSLSQLLIKANYSKAQWEEHLCATWPGTEHPSFRYTNIQMRFNLRMAIFSCDIHWFV